jgi:hypothetical protein
MSGCGCQIRLKPGTLRTFSGRTVHYTAMYVRQDRNSVRQGYTNPGRINFITVAPNICGPQYELASRHPSEAYNFRVGPKFFGKFVRPWRKIGRLINSDEPLYEAKSNFIKKI